jgi:hypothetical protein
VALAFSGPVDCVPVTASVPDQPPEAAQEVALSADQVSVALPPTDTALGPTLRLTVGIGALAETVTDCTALPPAPTQVKRYVCAVEIELVGALPVVGWLPDQAPDAVHEVALAADQVSTDVPPCATVLGLALKVTVGAGADTDTVAVCEARRP